jgi:hypothetical protein
MSRNFRRIYSCNSGEAGRKRAKLKSRTASAIELTQRRNIWPVRTDAAGIHRQTQIFRLLDAQPGVVQFRETITFRGNQSIAARKIHRTRRPVCAPALSYDGCKIIPVSSIPHVPPNAPGSSGPVTVLDAGIALSVTRISRETSSSPRLVWRRATQASSGADSNSIVVRKSHQKILCIDKVIG